MPGRVLWNEIDDPRVTAVDVADVSRLVEDSLATKFFEPHFDMATDSEQATCWRWPRRVTAVQQQLDLQPARPHEARPRVEDAQGLA
jgi:hypothetical protein